MCSIDQPVPCYGECHHKLEQCKKPDPADPKSHMVIPSGFRMVHAGTAKRLRAEAPALRAGGRHRGPIVGRQYNLNQEMCPSFLPFRCSTSERPNCNRLPFSSYSALQKTATCTTGIQMVEKLKLMNRCQNSATPFACSDGSCVT